jgi:hypothetical protein
MTTPKTRKKSPGAIKGRSKKKYPADEVIRVSRPVFEHIRKAARFGDTYDSVLRRELKLAQSE